MGHFIKSIEPCNCYTSIDKIEVASGPKKHNAFLGIRREKSGLHVSMAPIETWPSLSLHNNYLCFAACSLSLLLHFDECEFINLLPLSSCPSSRYIGLSHQVLYLLEAIDSITICILQHAICILRKILRNIEILLNCSDLKKRIHIATPYGYFYKNLGKPGHTLLIFSLRMGWRNIG